MDETMLVCKKKKIKVITLKERKVGIQIVNKEAKHFANGTQE